MVTTHTEMPILIIGGGIGGLTVAIALSRAGYQVHILEQADQFSEAGAGIQLSPNALYILEDLGLTSSLLTFATPPEGVRIFDCLSGECLTTIPFGAAISSRYGTPYWVTRRADLQSVLLNAAQSDSNITITTSFQVTAIQPCRDGIEAKSADGTTFTGIALIGADGLWSKIRSALGFSQPLRFSGRTAWRSLIPIDDLEAPFTEPFTGLWLAPKAHLVHYLVENGRTLNIVAIVEDQWHGEGWGIQGNASDLLASFRPFTDQIYTLLGRVQEWRKWALFEMQPLQGWSKGPVTLLGDAAHPTLPFLAQGGAMAIEDAAQLVHELKKSKGNFPGAFRRYEQIRRPRITRVQKTSRTMGKIYHMRGLARHARNARLRYGSPDRFLARYDWLYGYRAKDGA